jgi:hypothetical protein
VTGSVSYKPLSALLDQLESVERSSIVRVAGFRLSRLGIVNKCASCAVLH